MNKFRLRKIARQLASIGSMVEQSYMIEINNEPAMQFPDHDSLMSYLSKFRENNVIYSLKVFRINVYSL